MLVLDISIALLNKHAAFLDLICVVGCESTHGLTSCATAYQCNMRYTQHTAIVTMGHECSSNNDVSPSDSALISQGQPGKSRTV